MTDADPNAAVIAAVNRAIDALSRLCIAPPVTGDGERRRMFFDAVEAVAVAGSEVKKRLEASDEG